MMNYVAIIPARGGSKGIKDKNLQLVGGFSLVARAILAAKESGIERIIVSTDSDAIVMEAQQYGAEIHRRSEITSSDSAKTIDVIKEVVQDFGLGSEICVLLQPTSPLRLPEDIVRTIALYEQNKKKGSVVTITPCEHHPFKAIVLENDAYRPVTTLSDLEQPRQKLPQAFRINGAVYVIAFNDLINGCSFFAEPQAFVEMSDVRSIDIDTYDDLKRANQLV